MVLGLLMKNRLKCSDVERFYALFFDPGLKRGVHDMLLDRLGRRASGLEEGSHRTGCHERVTERVSRRVAKLH